MPKPKQYSAAELRKLSTDFRAVFSRAMRSEGENALPNLRRLRAFVESSELLSASISSATTPLQTPMKELEEAKKVHGRMNFPLDESAELGFLHALISGLCGLEGDDLSYTSRFYAGKFGTDSVPELLGDVLSPYFSHLNRVIEHRLIDAMERDGQHRGIRVDISGGTSQVNIAQDQSKLSANQRVTQEVQDLHAAAEALLRLLDESGSSKEYTELREVTEAVVEETTRDSPRKGILNTFVDRIRLLAAAATSGTEIAHSANGVAEQIGALLHHLK